MPKVSIGLPVYNGENFLRQSIESILDQTFQDFELIISDNSSTDSTERICREYAARDSRIRFYRQERNIGLAANFNCVFDLSRGQYFSWTSHDDLHSPEFLTRCVAALDSKPEAVLAYPRAIVINADGQEIVIAERNGKHFFTNREGIEVPIRPYDAPRRLEAKNVAHRFKDILLLTSWCMEFYGLIRSDALRKTRLHQPFDGGDKGVLVELSMMGPFVHVPELLFFYRQHAVQAQRYAAPGVLKDLYMTPHVRRGSIIPRLNNFNAYLQAALAAELAPYAKVQCCVITMLWFLQIRKWPQLLREALRNAAITETAKRNPPLQEVR